MPINWGQIGQIGSQLLQGGLSGLTRGGRTRGALQHYGLAPGFGPQGPPSAFGGDLEVYRPRRRRGITARDLASFRRVANLIKRYSRLVRSFRTRPGRR